MSLMKAHFATGAQHLATIAKLTGMQMLLVGQADALAVAKTHLTPYACAASESSESQLLVLMLGRIIRHRSCRSCEAAHARGCPAAWRMGAWVTNKVAIAVTPVFAARPDCELSSTSQGIEKHKSKRK